MYVTNDLRTALRDVLSDPAYDPQTVVLVACDPKTYTWGFLDTASSTDLRALSAFPQLLPLHTMPLKSIAQFEHSSRLNELQEALIALASQFDPEKATRQPRFASEAVQATLGLTEN